MSNPPTEPLEARRAFLQWVAASPLVAASGGVFGSGCASSHRDGTTPGPSPTRPPGSPAEALNLAQLELAAERSLGHDAMAYLAGGADDLRTLRANRGGFADLALRPRRLVDVRQVDTTVELFGETLASPILLAPVGFQDFFHPDGELASARAASRRGHRMILSSASCAAVEEVAREHAEPLWFQLYPTPDRAITRGLLRRAEAAGCTVVALTVDTPVIGNRERHSTTLSRLLAGGELRLGNFEGLGDYASITDAGLTWDMVTWLKKETRMRVVLKGIVTHEDARLALEYGADGLIVSNHGGRQLDAGRGTIECLPEVVAAVEGKMPVLLDGGLRRGTDVVMALALGARAVCIGRPYCHGLAAFGQAGVERALELLQLELERGLRLSGAPRLSALDAAFVHRS